MMYRQEQSISLTSFLSWFKLDRKCICNLATGFCAVHNNPSVAKTWTLNRLGKSIWSYYWHFLSNLNNTRKPLVKPATGWGWRHFSAMYTCGVWQTARSKLLRIQGHATTKIFNFIRNVVVMGQILFLDSMEKNNFQLADGYPICTFSSFCELVGYFFS